MKCPKVNKETCIGCGACAALCPDIFEMNSDGKSQVKKCEGCKESEVQQAIDSCPVQAITWEEE